MYMRLPTSWLTKLALLGTAIILVLLPFHATLTVFVSQFTGHYTFLRLWKEILLLILAICAMYIGVRQQAVNRQIFRSKLFWLVVAFLAVQLVWGVAALALHQVTPKALGYGWIVDTRFLIFFEVAWMLACLSPELASWWPRLVFGPALIVVAVGLLQYLVLPYDFMKHLGYGSATIFPYEDINHNVHYIRIMSTLRGANPLGAYLVLVISLFLAWAAQHLTLATKHKPYRMLAIVGLCIISCTLALILTFSRGAWLGITVSLVVLIWFVRRRLPLRLLGVVAAMLVGVLAVLGVLVFVVRNPAVQNVVLHTQDHSAVASTSDEGHASALQTGLSDLLREPLGRGPGTAGPASVYNTGHPVRIAENYFIQIGQETGWLGLLLFIGILIYMTRLLYYRRNHVLAVGLLAALAGLIVVNITSHAWADDTLAYVYWGLAGIACALPTNGNNKIAD